VFKIVKDHSWDANFGKDGVKDGANVEIPIGTAGDGTIQFWFNPYFESSESGVFVSYNVLNWGPATGISTVATTTEQAPVYNLAGQRVMNTQKGLYIMNGKKVVKK